MRDPLQEIIKQNKQSAETGIFSVCSANPYVLRAAMLRAKISGRPLLIEATSNQVDQFGGYTGMTPADFAGYVYKTAADCGFPTKKIILGGDHLGPNRWKNEAPEEAMDKAKAQVTAYVRVGFRKIHLDTSMPLQGDPADKHTPLDTGLAAERAAQLCRAAEDAAVDLGTMPVYVIGTDVPVPGGSADTEDDIRITRPQEVEETIRLTQQMFLKYGLSDAWQRVVAVVAQPGVEFSHNRIFAYNRERAAALKQKILDYPNMCYEAHSTDYQQAADLRKMVEDHFAVLKVGPWLTFALREVVFALTFIEKEMLAARKNVTLSHIEDVLEKVMLHNPLHWQSHYRGTLAEQRLARRYSLSDRIRYYWPFREVRQALTQLLNNLACFKPPLSLLSQFLPQQYEAIRAGEIENKPLDIVYHKIGQVLQKYEYACGQSQS